MMRDAILAFAEQFTYQPVIENKEKLEKKSQILVLGMGGSHLAADVFKLEAPKLQIRTHSDYGLPYLSEDIAKQTLVIASSYSGNTEETIDGLKQALERGLATAVISVGGKLIETAKKEGLAYVQLPNTGIQPRSALGLSLIALAALLDYPLDTFDALTKLEPASLETLGKNLATQLVDRTPIIYSSNKNQSLAYNWKIKLNETGKIPAFYNVIPELNHNEMTGFDTNPSSQALSKQMTVITLTDSEDHPKVQKRMQVVANLYRDRGIQVIEQSLTGKSRWERLFTSLILADWTAVSIADHYGLESEEVPMVEEFKKMITG